MPQAAPHVPRAFWEPLLRDLRTLRERASSQCAYNLVAELAGPAARPERPLGMSLAAAPARRAGLCTELIDLLLD